MAQQRKWTLMRFVHTGADWSGLKAATEYLESHGYSVGRMQGPSPIGVMKGEWDISKWRNMSSEEKAMLDGEIRPDGDSFRHYDAVVRFKGLVELPKTEATIPAVSFE